VRLAAALATLISIAAHAQAMQVPDPVSHDAASYVVESRCAGDPSNTDPWSCPDPAPRYGDTTVAWRKCDWGSAGVDHYQCSDAYMGDDDSVAVQTFSYPPFKQWNPTNGDGLQLVFVDASNGDVRLTLTQDGSTPAVQYFCPRGWVVADLALGTSSVTWTVEVAPVAIALGDPLACPPPQLALSAWTTMAVGYPFKISGKIVWRDYTTLMSEHFDAPTAAASTYMERTLNADRWGMLRWEAWEAPGGTRPPSADLPQRCPHLDFDSNNDWWPPLAGWTLYDCRTWTNIVPAPGWRGDDFHWGG
jgi:hypothetical protein